jgi:hypothetical protein
MLFTVRSFVHSSDQQQQKQARRTAATAAVAAAPAGPPAEYRSGSPSFKDASGSPMKEYENSPQGGASRTQKEIPIGGAVRESSRSLDITKVMLRECCGPGKPGGHACARARACARALAFLKIRAAGLAQPLVLRPGHLQALCFVAVGHQQRFT